MYSKFENLDDEKQRRILNAAMKEFVAKGYDDSSTNEIVREADISKGILFHYFKNKKQLYLYLFDTFIDMFVRELAEKVDMEERDFFLRIQNISSLKQQLIHQYPYIIRFLEKLYFEDSEEIREELEARKQKLLENNIGKFFTSIDTTKFKDGYDFQRIMNIVTWSFEGLANQYANEKDIDFDKVFKESEAYIEFFRQCFYK